MFVFIVLSFLLALLVFLASFAIWFCCDFKDKIDVLVTSTAQVALLLALFLGYLAFYKIALCL